MIVTSDEFYTYIWNDGKTVTCIPTAKLEEMDLQLPESFTISYDYNTSCHDYCQVIKADGVYFCMKRGYYFSLCGQDFEKYFPNLKIPEGIVKDLYIYKKES